jgi:hypothetical protein
VAPAPERPVAAVVPDASDLPDPAVFGRLGFDPEDPDPRVESG